MQNEPTQTSEYYITSRGRKVRRTPKPYWQCNEVTESAYTVMARDVPEPQSVREALTGEYAHEWRVAMHREFNSLIKNGTWRKESLPPGRNAIQGKWVFKVKPKGDGTIDKFKCRLVCKGFTQRYGIDYLETFAPVAKLTSVRLLFALAAQHNMVIRHLDFETAFLNGILEEEIFLQLPQQCAELLQTFLPAYDTAPVKLLKSLYGLKQAGRCWNRQLDACFKEMGFDSVKSDPCIYIKKSDGKQTIIGVFVDDCLVISDCGGQIEDLVKNLKQRYNVSDLGRPTQFLGMEVSYHDDCIQLSQERYIGDLLKKFKLENSNPSSTPYLTGVKLEKNQRSTDGTEEAHTEQLYAELVGSINWMATSSRPDLARIASQLCRFVSKPQETHWKAAVKVLKYLKGTQDYGLCFARPDDSELLPYKSFSYFVSCFNTDFNTRRP